MIAGLFNIIPLIGPWVGAVPGIIIALTTGDGVSQALWVAAIMAGAQQIDNHFISPLVMQRAVKLHPAVVMLTLLAGGTLGGFFGLLLAVPLMAALKVIVGHLWRTYILDQPLEQEAVAFAAMDAQPGGVVEDVDARSETLDRLAYPVDADAEPAEGGVATATDVAAEAEAEVEAEVEAAEAADEPESTDEPEPTDEEPS